MKKAFLLGLGSNSARAEEIFSNFEGCLLAEASDLRKSRVYQSEVHYDKPGYSREQCLEREPAPFLNAVWVAHSELSPQALLAFLLDAERRAGRERRAGYLSRTLDLDLLLYEDYCSESLELSLPHPRMHLRNFVLVPACEVAADWLHPSFGLSLQALRDCCPDRLTLRAL